MKKYQMMMFAMLMMATIPAFAQETEVSVESAQPDFLDGFMSFGGLVTVIVPLVVGFVSSKLKKPMNKWVTFWVTALVGVAVTFFSWWMGLGFPPADTSVWGVLIDALFVVLASAGVVSVVTSEWLAGLFGNKAGNKK